MQTELASWPVATPQPMTLPANLVTRGDMEAAFMSLSSGIDSAHERVEKVEGSVRDIKTSMAFSGTQGPGNR